MTAAECVRRVIDALDSLGISFMAVGSFSSNVYGFPRSTKDADFVVELGNVPIARLATTLGGEFTLDPQMAFETVTTTTAYRLTHRGTAFMIELFGLSADPHDQARFARRVPGNIGGQRVFVPTAEDVIITKLRWSGQPNRGKDLDDIRGILMVQGERLDIDYIRLWADRHGTRSILERLLSQPGP